ncbi:MAG: hypothetical protein K2Z81_09105 [Cyanobacteria bacterium]|nr:hypothetical protein [Cyanobacteriota bacterium]
MPGVLICNCSKSLSSAVLSEHLSKEGEWTESMKEAWEEALKVVSHTMIEEADNPELFKDEPGETGYGMDGFKRTEPRKRSESTHVVAIGA